VSLTALLSLIGALAAAKNFLGNFNNFLLLILRLFIPWTAVNLVDFYIVRRGHYAIAETFNPRGLYGPSTRARRKHSTARTSPSSSGCRRPGSSTTSSPGRWT
jgi:purine-cytosine permease-like protein